MNKLIITEKPSVAMEIAKVLKINQRSDGYLYNDKYTISWAVGHLVELAEPKVYDQTYSKWNLNDLPIIPQKVQFVVKKGTKKQFQIIKKQILKADSIICATDAGREGELIFRLIYRVVGKKKPIERLWVSSLTKQAIQAGFAALQPISNYNNLYAAAMSRQVSDWLVGLNATRALTMQAGGNTLLSVGRVQTPTLRLIAERYLAHINFKPEPFWQPELVMSYNNQQFKAVYFERLNDKNKAKEIVDSLQGIATTKLISVTNKERKEQPPLLYDLTGLQKKVNNLFGYSAKETLSIAQKLYEKKYITYPRTDSKHLTDDMKGTMKARLQNVGVGALQPAYETIEKIEFSKRYFNNYKVTDHHAIIPTNEPAKTLPVKENNVYLLIAASLIMAFMKPCIKLLTTYNFEPNGHKFLSKGTVVLQEGWRMAELFKKNDKEEDELLPKVPQNETVKIVAVNNQTKHTKAPPLLTVATLLALMENAGKLVEDEEEEILNKFGIGTPATRAGIIDVLFKRNYIANKGKSLIPIETGLMLYHLTKELYISNIEMTGNWEYKLKQIEAGEQPVIQFKQQIEAYTKKIVDEIKAMVVQRTDMEECPKCRQKKLLKKSKLLDCTNDGCDFQLWFTIAGKKITAKNIKDLMNNGHTAIIKGFKGKKGKFDTALKFDDNMKIKFNFK